MHILKRVIFVVFCFFAAMACYAFGVPVGGFAFLVLGLIFEGLFWVGIFGRKKSPVNHES